MSSNSLLLARPRLSIPLFPFYGLDAPLWVLGFFVVGLFGILAPFFLDLPSFVFSVGISFAATGLWMILGSLIMKVVYVRSHLRSLPWTGSESILDLGTGRGMMLFEALAAREEMAKERENEPQAIGIDVWNSGDQLANSMAATASRAESFGAASLIRLETGDARDLSRFADNSFDRIVSSFMIHNLLQSSDRQLILSEAHRCLAPGGILLVTDIFYPSSYANFCRENLNMEVELSCPMPIFGLLLVKTLKATKK